MRVGAGVGVSVGVDVVAVIGTRNPMKAMRLHSLSGCSIDTAHPLRSPADNRERERELLPLIKAQKCAGERDWKKPVVLHSVLMFDVWICFTVPGH